MRKETEYSWKEHRVLRGDGRGGYVVHPAQYRFVPRYRGVKVLPFGLAATDNGEILLTGAARTGRGPSVYGETVASISADLGVTWSEYETAGFGPAVRLTWLGLGRPLSRLAAPLVRRLPGARLGYRRGRPVPGGARAVLCGHAHGVRRIPARGGARPRLRQRRHLRLSLGQRDLRQRRPRSRDLPAVAGIQSAFVSSDASIHGASSVPSPGSNSTALWRWNKAWSR